MSFHIQKYMPRTGQNSEARENIFNNFVTTYFAIIRQHNITTAFGLEFHRVQMVLMSNEKNGLDFCGFSW